MILADIHQQLVFEIKDGLSVVASGVPMEEIGYVFEELSGYFQGLGVCHLLEYADKTEFRENLVRSGYAWRYYLTKSREQDNLNDQHLALSRTAAFLDAIAASDFALAREIARLSITKWEANWEYGDDFYYYSFLHAIVLSGGHLTESELDPILQEFKNALAGADPLRLEVCRYLFTRDGEGFNEIFQNLMEETCRLLDEKRELVGSDEILFWPRSYVSVEGLALLKIAELLGIQTFADYPLCPSIARLSTTTQNFRDPFREIENMLASRGSPKRRS